MQLIICYELYIKGDYTESLLEIESAVQFLKCCIFCETNKPFSEAWNHIAQATYEYIALTLNLDFKKVNFYILFKSWFQITK